MVNPRRKWYVVVVLFWTLFFVGGVLGSWGVFFDPLLAYLHVTRAKLAVLPTLIGVIGYGGGPVVGWILDRFAGRWVVAAGLVLVCGSMLLCASAHSYALLFVGMLIFSLGFAGCSAVTVGTVISRWFATGRGLGMGSVFAGYALGSSVLLQVCGYIIRHFGWRLAYVAISIPVALLILPALWFLGNPPWEGAAPESGERAIRELPGLEVREGIHGRSFWLINLATLAYAFEAGVLIVHAVPNLIALGVSSVHAVTALSLGFLMSAAAKPVFGNLADKFGVPGTLAFCLTGSAIGCFAVTHGNLAPFMVVFVIGFTLAQIPIVLFPALAADTYGVKRYGTLYGLNSLVYVIGQLLGPILAGATFDKYGSYSPIFILCGTLTLASVLLPFGCVRFAAPGSEQAKLAQGAPG